MASKHEIKVNFQLAKQQAARLEEIADSIDGIGNGDFAETLQQISKSWRGENARMYLEKGNQLQSDMSGSAKTLRQIASEIRTKAERIYWAEMKSIETAKSRKN